MKKKHVKQPACQTRRIIFVASFEWVRVKQITCANCQEKTITAAAIKELMNQLSVFSLRGGEGKAASQGCYAEKK